MRRYALLLLLLCSTTSSLAQPAPAAPAPTTPAPTTPAPTTPAPTTPAPTTPAPTTPAPTTPAPTAPAPATPDAPAAAEPTAEPLAQPTEPAPAEEPEPVAPPAAVPPPEPLVPSPADLEARLTAELPPPTDASPVLTAPVPVFTLHGYMRMRGELMDTFWLGRRPVGEAIPDADRREPDPFTRFRPLERRPLIEGGGEPTNYNGKDCVDEDSTDGGLTCDVSTLRFANLRLRLTPQLNLSEDVRIKMTLDVLDNVIAGEPPGTYYGNHDEVGGNTGAEQTFFAGTVVPGEEAGQGDSIKARRAWAEVRNRDLGELRFGRMPMHWGLGMLYNAGDDLDDDRSTDLDRVLATTKLAGFYLTASYDFLSEGFFDNNDPLRPLEQSQLDDVDQLTFSVARRHSPEELLSSLERGEVVLNGGFQLSIRNQDAVYMPSRAGSDDWPLQRIEATTYTMDLWGLLRYRGFRTELEAAWNTGGMESFVPDLNAPSSDRRELDVSQLGYALETELRLLDDKLAIYFDHGLATGDSGVEGLSSNVDYVTQPIEHGDDTISTFRFHPSYRVDMILWRNLMGQVTGAYYFKPGIGYDFIKNDFGELLGARLDFVWSRATSFVQTWGNDEDLGIELDVSLYFRSEDGPELTDGFHAMAQYGVLFPMRGLGYNFEDTDLEAAQTLRLLLGVVF